MPQRRHLFRRRCGINDTADGLDLRCRGGDFTHYLRDVATGNMGTSLLARAPSPAAVSTDPRQRGAG